jgi:hypothetical protein
VAETQKFAEGYDAIFGGKKRATKAAAKPAARKPAKAARKKPVKKK